MLVIGERRKSTVAMIQDANNNGSDMDGGTGDDFNPLSYARTLKVS